MIFQIQPNQEKSYIPFWWTDSKIFFSKAKRGSRD